jgi:tetratricopeptide (TPR) repeat protein
MPSLLERLRDAVAPDFTVERELGRGGMGVVFLGQDTALDRPVAIKVLVPERATARAAERFVREARLLAKVRHPNIIPIYQVRENKGLFFYIMEYLEGETVAARLKRGPLSQAAVIRLGADLLRGLEATHEHRIVHRDVKPSNIFLLPDRAILGDFGIARASMDPDQTLTGAEGIVGTPRYMAPEQRVAGSRVDERTDLYSAGLVLYEALVGELPTLPGSSAPLRWSRLPRRLRAVLQRAVEGDPDRRWQNARSFRQALLHQPLVEVRVGALVLGLVAAIAIIGREPWGNELPPPPPRADLALLPFESPDTGRIGRTLARHAGDRLQWFGRWTFQPSSRTFAWADSIPEAERQDRASRELNVGLYVAGRVVSTPDGPALELTVRDSTGRALNLSPLRVAGSAEDVPAWGLAAADAIVGRAFPEHYQEWRELEPRGPADARAWDDYFKADSAFQQDAYDKAEQHYLRALARDSQFVQASLRLAIVRRLRRVPFEADLKTLYQQSGSELPEQHRQLIEALLEPDLVRRFARYRQAVTAFPRDATVRFIYADELFHRAPLVGIPLETALIEFGRLIQLHANLEQAPTYDHLLWGQLRLGLRTDADSSLRKRFRIPFSGEAEEARRRRFLQLAYDARFRPRIAGPKLWWVSNTADSVTLEGIQRYVRLGNAFDIPGAQLALGRSLAQRGRTPLARASGRRAQGLALMLLGRPGEALPHLEAALEGFGRPDSAVERAEWRVLPPVLGFPAVDSAARAWGRSRLQQLVRDPAQAPRAAWALAVDADAAEDTLGLATWTNVVATAAPGNRIATRLTLQLQAMQAAARAGPASGLKLSAPLLAYDSAGVIDDPFSRAVLHKKRSEWLLALGDSVWADRELLWYENSDSGIEGWIQRELQPGEVDAMVSGVMRLRRAQLAFARRDSARACPWVRRVSQLWSGAEPAFESLVRQVRELEERCGSGK